MKKINQMVEKSRQARRRALEQFTTAEETLIAENKELSNAIKMVEEEQKNIQKVKTESEGMLKENEGIIFRNGNIVRGDGK